MKNIVELRGRISFVKIYSNFAWHVLIFLFFTRCTQLLAGRIVYFYLILEKEID